MYVQVVHKVSCKDAAIIAEEVKVQNPIPKKAATIRIVINFTCLTYETSLMPARPETNR
jgi:hypothetical protein